MENPKYKKLAGLLVNTKWYHNNLESEIEFEGVERRYEQGYPFMSLRFLPGGSMGANDAHALISTGTLESRSTEADVAKAFVNKCEQ